MTLGAGAADATTAADNDSDNHNHYDLWRLNGSDGHTASSSSQKKAPAPELNVLTHVRTALRLFGFAMYLLCYGIMVCHSKKKRIQTLE